MLVHTFVASVLAAAVLVAPIGGDAKAAGDTSDEATIRSVLSSYEEALNASNTDAVIRLYAEDGVFMPPYSHSAIGKNAVRGAYIAVFKAITLHVKFNIAEVVQMSPEWAFVRTNSAGTNKVNATEAMSAEEIRSSSFSKRIAMATGKSLATASRAPTRHQFTSSKCSQGEATWHHYRRPRITALASRLTEKASSAGRRLTLRPSAYCRLDRHEEREPCPR